jgi:hypothetical protein
MRWLASISSSARRFRSSPAQISVRAHFVSALGFPVKARPFSRRGAGCTLGTVRNGSSTLLIAALLMFQLAFGVHWQLANAATVLPVQGMNALDGEHCPVHHPQPSEADQRLGAQSRSHVPAFPHAPINKHDCCRSLGCQCHSTQSPALIELPIVSVSPASLRVPVFDARNPAAPTSEFFRPPIA